MTNSYLIVLHGEDPSELEAWQLPCDFVTADWTRRLELMAENRTNDQWIDELNVLLGEMNEGDFDWEETNKECPVGQGFWDQNATARASSRAELSKLTFIRRPVVRVFDIDEQLLCEYGLGSELPYDVNMIVDKKRKADSSIEEEPSVKKWLESAKQD